MQRVWNLVLAMVVSATVVAQLVLLVSGGQDVNTTTAAAPVPLATKLLRFFSYFTVLSNTLVATVLTCELTSRESAARRWFLQSSVSSGVAVSIAVVSLAYNLLLRHLWHPQGWQWLADELLHDIMPLLFLVYWWCCVPKGLLRLGHIAVWVIYPLLYFGYSLLRGHLLAVYPYPFVDVEKLGYPQVFINAGGLLAGFVLIALLMVGLDRRR